ncbi:MAG: hypothetical protein ACRDMZ_05915, partial [Solirubrobacteraceae bacterium]
PQIHTPPPPPTLPAWTPPPPPPPQIHTPPSPPTLPAWTPPRPQPTHVPPPTAPPTPPASQAAAGDVVKQLAGLVLENWRSYPLDEETLSLLQVGLPYLVQRECQKDAILAGQTAARLGYMARAAEFAEIPSARASDNDLFDELSESLEEAEKRGDSIAGAMAEFAADLAISEPIDPPASDAGPSWSLPGVDGSVRGLVRDRLLKGVPVPSEVTRENLQQTWKYGYFLRCLEEFFFDDE